MGLSIAQEQFEPLDYKNFSDRVRLDLSVLQQLLQRQGFGEGPGSIGAEVEFYIVDADCRVKPINSRIEVRLEDPLLTMELNRFNLEYNLSPQPFSGSPFLRSENELNRAVERINEVAAPLGGKLVSIGILPTLRKKNINASMMTDVPRYHVLSKALCEMRGGPFQIHIGGRDELNFEADDVTLEGANTSYQLHWRVPASRFADYYNAVQLVTPVVLGLAANSPSLFQKNLWDETRIALFKQSIDSRTEHERDLSQPPRVYFGNGWVRSAWETFAAAVALYKPIIPIVGEEDPRQVLAAGGTPALEQLRLHHGTTWPWNRAVYDHNEGGHLRIEMRALPAGPTAIDMSANGLFMIGAALALVDEMPQLASVMPFHYAEHNFYRAAKYGLDATLIWPGQNQFELREQPLAEIAASLLPRAQEALATTELDSIEIRRLLSVIGARLEAGISGSRWQRAMTAKYRRRHGKREAYKLMLEQYMANSDSRRPLHEWSMKI